MTNVTMTRITEEKFCKEFDSEVALGGPTWPASQPQLPTQQKTATSYTFALLTVNLVSTVNTEHKIHCSVAQLVISD